jgi:diguanylate cyclase (GGDEF)-like protein
VTGFVFSKVISSKGNVQFEGLLVSNTRGESMPDGKTMVSRSVSVQKALWILEVLKGLPAGDVIYKQVEQVLMDLDQHHANIEQVYSSMIYVLLDAYLQHLSPGTPLYIQVKMLQRRVQPPLWEPDLDTLKAQMDIYADHIINMQSMDAEKIAKFLSPILNEAEQVEPVDPPVVQTKEPRQEAQPVTPSTPRRRYTDLITDKMAEKKEVSDFYRKTKTWQGAEDVSRDLSREIHQAIAKNQEFGVILNVLSTELNECNSGANLEVVRNEMKSLLEKLNTSHHELVDNLELAHRRFTSLQMENEELGDELERARMLSMTDELTELPNRRAFLDRLEDEVGRVQRHKLPLSLAIIDLDDFKTVNDQHGHTVGDEVLRTYAADVFTLFRQYDMVARYGGEEFAVLLPNTDKDGALCALTKIKHRAQELRCKHRTLDIPVPSFSAGLAVYQEGESPDTYIERADRALYKAKSLGRDRFELDLH